MKFKVIKREIILSEVPTEQGVLKITFFQSRYWKQRHKSELPQMTCDVNKGQTHYQLPRYFWKKNIRTIDILGKK